MTSKWSVIQKRNRHLKRLDQENIIKTFLINNYIISNSSFSKFDIYDHYLSYIIKSNFSNLGVTKNKFYEILKEYFLVEKNIVKCEKVSLK